MYHIFLITVIVRCQADRSCASLGLSCGPAGLTCALQARIEEEEARRRAVVSVREDRPDGDNSSSSEDGSSSSSDNSDSNSSSNSNDSSSSDSSDNRSSSDSSDGDADTCVNATEALQEGTPHSNSDSDNSMELECTGTPATEQEKGCDGDDEVRRACKKRRLMADGSEPCHKVPRVEGAMSGSEEAGWKPAMGWRAMVSMVLQQCPQGTGTLQEAPNSNPNTLQLTLTITPTPCS